MAFLRMLLPAWVAGLYASLLLALLILFLNPPLSASPVTLAGLLPLCLLLSFAAALGWPLAYRFLRVFARHRLRVRGIPFKYLYGFACADLFVVAGLYWFNAAVSKTMVPPLVGTRLRLAAGLVTLAALIFLPAATLPPLRRRAGSRAGFHLLALALPAVILALRPGHHPVPIPRYTAEPVAPPASVPRMLVLGIEGATLDQILPMVAQGRLPWFARLLQQGAHGRLTTFRPCQAPSVWQSLLTGCLPFKHQILDFDRYRLPLGPGEIRLLPRGFGFRRVARYAGLRRAPQDLRESRSMTLREILESLGQPVREFGRTVGIPPAAAEEDLPDIRLDRFLDPEVPIPPGTESLPEALRGALQEDQSAAAAALEAWRAGKARTVILVLRGLDRVSHLFLRYGMPGGFGDVPQDEEEKYGSVLARYYRFLDEWLGKFLGGEETAAEGSRGARWRSAFLVVSPHGIEPLPLGRRLVRWMEGQRLVSGYHARGPDGMILAAGPDIRHGTPLGKASILDVVPTILYYDRLPIGKDMDGHALTRLFEPSFTAENPILLIPSYKARRGVRPGNPPR